VLVGRAQWETNQTTLLGRQTSKFEWEHLQQGPWNENPTDLVFFMEHVIGPGKFRQMLHFAELTPAVSES
jgi:hypothetical protein